MSRNNGCFEKGRQKHNNESWLSKQIAPLANPIGKTSYLFQNQNLLIVRLIFLIFVVVDIHHNFDSQ